MCLKTVSAAFALISLSSLAAADLTVGTNLGALGFGTTSYSGTTFGASNNASYYSPGFNPTLNWDGEFVYQFSVSANSTLSILDTTDGSVDFDYFLLNSLGTRADGAGKTYAYSTRSFADEDDSLLAVGPGTYYLAVDTYRGEDSVPPKAGGAFTFDLSIEAFTPPDAPTSTASALGGSTSQVFAAGQVGFYSFDYSGGAFTIDTEGSSLDDTEIGLYDSLGNLIDSDDDSGTDGLSSLAFLEGDLVAGRYFLAVGAYNTTFGEGFAATSISTSTGTIQINGIQPVPEPATMAALGLGIVAMIRRRRAN